MSLRPAVASFAAVGASQGLALWLLWRAAHDGSWPASSPPVYWAALFAALALPLAYYVSHGTAAPAPRRRLLLAAIGVGFAALGAYVGWSAAAVAGALPGRSTFGAVDAGQVIGATALGFVVVPLHLAWRVAGARGWHYPALFEIAWRNAMLGVTVVLLVAVFWLVLLAGSLLMGSLGLTFVGDLMTQPWFAIPVSAVVTACAFAMGLARAEALIALRRYWLAITAWLLPLVTVFALMWLVALPLIGLDPLLKTRNAAFVLLWFAALAIHFANSAWQDGAETTPYPRWLAWALQWAWMALIPVVAIAGWALLQRVTQYGWSPDRVWGGFIWLLGSGYVLGYAGSSLRLKPLTERWMSSVGATNVIMACVMVIGLVLLLSPVADPRRLTVASQMHRLERGLAAELFDYKILYAGAGRYGHDALVRLAAGDPYPGGEQVGARARQVLAERGGDPVLTNERLDLQSARERVQVLPPGAVVPDDFLDRIRGARADRRDTQCLSPDAQCVAWVADVDGDGASEIVLLHKSAATGHGTQGAIYHRRSGDWRYGGGFYSTAAPSVWVEAVQGGRVLREPARWPDLILNGERHLIRRDAGE